MDHIRILRRAFEIVRSYRMLWIFGLILALTAGRSGPNTNYSMDRRDFNNREFDMPFNFPDLREMPDWRSFPNWNIDPQVSGTIFGVVIALICLGVILGIIFTVLRYVAINASIRLVDLYESTGERMSFRAGWRMGWNRTALRLFLIDLLFGVAGFVLFLLLMALVALPLLLLVTGSEVLSVLGVVSATGLFVLAVLVLIVIAAVLSLLQQFFHRAAVLENLGVFEAIRRGWTVLRRRLGDSVIMGLMLFGLGLLVAVILIPVALVLVALGALAGGAPALAVAMLMQQFVQNTVPVIITAVLVGLPIFLLVVAVPMSFLRGLFEIFTSAAWTLVYRELSVE
jgi:hypothetical protein